MGHSGLWSVPAQHWPKDALRSSKRPQRAGPPFGSTPGQPGRWREKQVFWAEGGTQTTIENGNVNLVFVVFLQIGSLHHGLGCVSISLFFL